MSETNLAPSQYPGGGSAMGQAIGFITEFNQNAAIFNEQLAPLLASAGLSAGGEEGFQG